MNTVNKTLQLTPGFVPESTYESLKYDFELLQRFIGKTSLNEIKRLQEVEKELAVVKATLLAKEEAYNTLKKETDKRVELVRNSTLRTAEVERERAVKNKQYNMQERTVKPLEKKVEAVTEERDRIQRMYDGLLEKHKVTHQKLDEVLRNQAEDKEKLEEIINILGTSKNIEEAREEVKKVIKSDYSLQEGDEMIHQAILDGKRNKDIAEILYPGDDSGCIKISQRIKTKRYQKKYGNETFR